MQLWCHLCSTSTINLLFPQLSIDHPQEDDRGLLSGVLILAAVLLQSYNLNKLKYSALRWPPPKLRGVVNELVEYVAAPSEV